MDDLESLMLTPRPVTGVDINECPQTLVPCRHWHFDLIIEVPVTDLPWPDNLAAAITGDGEHLRVSAGSTIRSMN